MAEGRRSSRAWIDDPELPRVIRLLRQEAGWSQRNLAQAAGLTPSAVTRIESGDRRPSVDVFERLAEAFGLPPSYLVELATRLARADDEEAATEVMEVVRSFTPSSSLASRYGQEGTTAQETAPAYESCGLAPLERPEIAATIPDGELRWVFRRSVGRDERGYWIDPAARANRGGLDAEDVRIERLDDGTFVVDLDGLQHEIGPRDPERHITLARVAGFGESSLYDAYAATVLEIVLPSGPRIEVEPVANGTVNGHFPDGVSVVHVITAFNPRSRLLMPAENAERNRLLRGDLEARKLRTSAAVGRSPDGSWAEDSFALFGAEEETLLELARDYEQNAIFRWTRKERAVVFTADERATSEGWRTSAADSSGAHGTLTAPRRTSHPPTT